MEATKKVQIEQYKAYREKSKDTWCEFIAIYDNEGNLIDRGVDNHPEGMISHHWEGFEFIAPFGYTGEPRTECFVKVDDRLFFEKPH